MHEEALPPQGDTQRLQQRPRTNAGAKQENMDAHGNALGAASRPHGIPYTPTPGSSHRNSSENALSRARTATPSSLPSLGGQHTSAAAWKDVYKKLLFATDLPDAELPPVRVQPVRVQPVRRHPVFPELCMHASPLPEIMEDSVWDDVPPPGQLLLKLPPVPKAQDALQDAPDEPDLSVEEFATQEEMADALWNSATNLPRRHPYARQMYTAKEQRKENRKEFFKRELKRKRDLRGWTRKKKQYALLRVALGCYK